MLQLRLSNRYCSLRYAKSEILKRLSAVTSYLVAGYYFVPAYKERRWDGKEKLLTYSQRDGYRFPIGLLSDVMDLLDKKFIQYEVIDERIYHDEKIDFPWNIEASLRDYQKEAVASILSGDIFHGSGILKMPPRSGKTRTAGKIIHELKRRALVVVPSQLLLYQTQKSLEYLLGIDVGIIGDSSWHLEDVTVATVQTLLKGYENKSQEFACTKDAFDVLIVDEIHHLKGKAWKNAVMELDCKHRIGLSATVYFDNKKEMAKGVIWTKAVCGDICYEKSLSWMIEHGYLVKPTVEIYKVTKPDLTKIKWSKDMQDQAVYTNGFRNRLIVDIVKKHLAKGLNILVVSNRIKQVRELEKLCSKSGIKYGTVTGTTSNFLRQERIKKFAEGKVPVLIGTVFGEGVDIPEIDVVINAEGGRSVVSTVQRLRNLTPHQGKKKATFIEFADLTNAYLAEHSQRRINEYRKERAFKLRVVSP